jgi:hypothetical protein
VLEPFDRDDDVRGLAGQIIALGQSERNPWWQAEAHWALAALEARRHAWRQAFDEFGRARTLYAADGIARSLAPVLADLAAAAAEAGDSAKAREAAGAFRAIADGQPAWRDWLPLIDAYLRKADGDRAGAADDLARLLDAKPGVQGPVAQAALFQLGRWQIEMGRPGALLARAEWKTWLDQQPDAIALRISALRASGQAGAADAEQQRLDALLGAPVLALDPTWLASD